MFATTTTATTGDHPSTTGTGTGTEAGTGTYMSSRPTNAHGYDAQSHLESMKHYGGNTRSNLAKVIVNMIMDVRKLNILTIMKITTVAKHAQFVFVCVCTVGNFLFE